MRSRENAAPQGALKNIARRAHPIHSRFRQHLDISTHCGLAIPASIQATRSGGKPPVNTVFSTAVPPTVPGYLEPDGSFRSGTAASRRRNGRTVVDSRRVPSSATGVRAPSTPGVA